MVQEPQASTKEQAPVAWWRPLAASLPIFLITRATIFFAATAATDSQVYHQYGLVLQQDSLAGLYSHHDVEYPQLAALFGYGVECVAGRLPEGAEQVIAARKSNPHDTGTARFQVALGLVLFGFDAGLLLLIAWLVRAESPQFQKWRLGLYIAGTAALGPILYDRLDLIVGGVVLAAFLALRSYRSFAAYALLTAGVGFKLVPVLLFPVFVLGAVSIQGKRRFWPTLVREAAIAAAILATWPVLAYLFSGGDRAFVFLKYHGVRGPELGSVYAIPLLLSGDVDVIYAFNSFTLRGSMADAVSHLSPAIVLVALGLAFLVFVRALRQPAQPDRLPVLMGCVLVWLAFMLTNKVGSPQYLLWLAPLVPFLPLKTRSDRNWAVGFVIAGVLATVVYPYMWYCVTGRLLPDKPEEVWSGPNVAGYILLSTRWVVVATLTIWLGVRLWKLGSRNVTAEVQSSLAKVGDADSRAASLAGVVVAAHLQREGA